MIRHFVTDRRRYGLTPGALVERAARAARAGVDIVQIREPDLEGAALAALVRAAIDACRGTRARVLVNSRADVAVATGAAGVHLRGDAPPASRLRVLLAPGSIVGRSVHTLDDIDSAVADGGCDYLMFGTVFESAGKPPGHAVAGLDGLRAACRRSPLPVIAIGGVTADRERDVAVAGAAGLAAVGRFM